MPINIGIYVNPSIILPVVNHDDDPPKGLEINTATDSPLTPIIKAKIPKQKKMIDNLNDFKTLFLISNPPWFFWLFFFFWLLSPFNGFFGKVTFITKIGKRDVLKC